MDTKEFEEKYHYDGEVGGDNVICVVEGDEIVNHKAVYNVDVYKVGDGDSAEYFEVTFSRDNSGYWGDGERHEPEFRKVKPVYKQVVQTFWVDA